MADLMSDVCTYEDLANKYGNFHVPAVRLYVSGRDVVQNLGLEIQSLEIALSLSEAGTAVIRLAGLYDLKARSFDDDVKDKFKLGTIVEVGIGYVSEIQKVFKGYVAELGAEFGKTACLVVTLADVRRLMMRAGVHHVLHEAANYSDAVQTILDTYAKLCTSEIDATNDQLESPLSQRSGDYDFITRELIGGGRCDREFFVVGDTAYFRKPRKVTAAVCSVEFGRELQEFRVTSAYTDLEVNVTGYNQREQNIITAAAEAKSTEDQSSLLTQAPVHNIVDPQADTQDKADVRAQVYADRHIVRGQIGYGVCIGLPELIPGRFVEIVMLEEMANKKFYIKRVRHKIDEVGFVTEFETEGWA